MLLFHWQHSVQLKIVLLALTGALAAAALQRAPRRAAVAVIGVAAVLLPVLASTPRSPLSDDLYRYALDGQVQAAGIDPYGYAPLAPQLEQLRTPWLYPSDAGCRNLGYEPRCTRVNRPLDHTIYPPVAELFFLGEHAVGLAHLEDRGYQLAGLAVVLALLAIMLALLRSSGRDPRLAAWWVLAPFGALALVADAHVDGLAIVLSLAAVLVARRGHAVWAVVLVALAAMVKLYPGLLLFAFLDLRRPRQTAGQVAAFVGVCVASYLPHVLAVGTKVLGYLPGYLQEEHYDAGTRYLLLGIVHITGAAATALVAVGMLATIAVVLWRRPEPLTGCLWLYAALFLLATPAQPWYLASLAVVAVCAARPEWIAVATAAYPLYFANRIDHDPVRDGEIAYGAAVLIVVAVTLWRRYRLPRSGSEAKVPIPTSNVVAGA
ncbi:MAG: glycosyltransferase 87 family protein [Mycobacteriales bacterium]